MLFDSLEGMLLKNLSWRSLMALAVIIVAVIYVLPIIKLQLVAV